MKISYSVATIVSLLFLSACAETTVTPVSRNQIILNTSTSSDCSTAQAAHVASQMAAVETIRHGFERYIVQGASTSSNTDLFYTAGTLYDFGTKDARLQVLMLNPGDSGFDNALDAKSVLGAEWEKLVEDGIQSCFS